MTVVINAAATRVGGGLTYLEQVVNPLSWALRSRGETLLVLTSERVARGISTDSAAPGTVVRSRPWMHWSGAPRILAEQILLPGIVRRSHGSVVFGVSDTLPLLTTAPCVVLCRNALITDTEKRSLRYLALRWFSRQSLRKAAVVISVSHQLAEALEPVLRSSQSLAIVHHGPGSHPLASTLSLHGGGQRLLSVGSLYRHKRVELAIEAVHLLHRTHPAISLTIVGRGIEPDYERSLRELVVERGLEDRVDFLGELTSAELASHYRDAAALVVTSKMESFCHPILEAFSAGVPVVISEDLMVGREIAADGALFFPADPSALASVIERVLARGPEVHTLISRASTQLKAFDWSETAERTADLLIGAGQSTTSS